MSLSPPEFVQRIIREKEVLKELAKATVNLGSRYDDIGVHSNASYEVEELEGINIIGIWKFV